MGDVSDERQPDEEAGRHNAEDERHRWHCGERQREERAIRAEAAQMHERPEDTEQDEEVRRGIRVVFPRDRLAREKIIEQAEKKAGLDLVGVRDVVGRPRGAESIEKDEPARGAEEQENEQAG